ncbi:MAG: hypothetical protein U0869_23115 [Chloroflexota bacterium]
MSNEIRSRLNVAQQGYAAALERRGALQPGDPGYHRAVHEVGVRWTQLVRLERAARTVRVAGHVPPA